MLSGREKRQMQMNMEKMERQNHFRMASGMANFIGALLGVVCILIFAALIFSIVNWLLRDIGDSFIFLETSLR